MPKKKTPQNAPTVVENAVTLDISDAGTPRLVVNGIDLAPMVDPDWTLANVVEDGTRLAKLNVTFSVVLP